MARQSPLETLLDDLSDFAEVDVIEMTADTAVKILDGDGEAAADLELALDTAQGRANSEGKEYHIIVTIKPDDKGQ